jgi:hypothetical protein
MTWFRIGMACAVSVALVACHKTEQGVLQPIPPLAGLRYVNLVNDTGAVDFRVVNFIGDAPNAGQASFRTGGQPYGISTGFLPPHWPVEANRDVEVRVFMNGLDPAVSSTVVFDTTMQFAENVNYTFYLYGSARTANGVHAYISVDTLPSAPAGVAFRVINLGGASVGNVDVDVVNRDTLTLSGTAPFAAVAPGARTGYTNFAVSGAYKAVITAPASRTPFLFQALAPAGAVGTATTNPVAGTAVAGTAVSAVIVPASVSGSQAPSGDTFHGFTSVTLSNDTVTVVTSANHGLAVNGFFNVSGANEAEYNGPHTVLAVDSTKGFKYRIVGTPTSPATGTVGFRSATNDFTLPYVIFLIDRQPALSAP